MCGVASIRLSAASRRATVSLSLYFSSVLSMKRSDTKRPVKRTGDVRKDLTQNQLAWIGSIALAYNETERLVDVIFGISLSLSELSYDVVSRINGTEGRVEIIKLAIRELGCPELMCVAFADTLGNNGFSLLKKFRDRIIHASIVDAAAAIARSPAKRGSFEEVLLTVDALKALYRRMQLEPISKSFEEDNEAGQLEKAEEILEAAEEIAALSDGDGIERSTLEFLIRFVLWAHRGQRANSS